MLRVRSDACHCDSTVSKKAGVVRNIRVTGQVVVGGGGGRNIDVNLKIFNSNLRNLEIARFLTSRNVKCFFAPVNVHIHRHAGNLFIGNMSCWPRIINIIEAISPSVQGIFRIRIFPIVTIDLNSYNSCFNIYITCNRAVRMFSIIEFNNPIGQMVIIVHYMNLYTTDIRC